MKKTFKLFVSAVAAMATLAGCAKNEISNQTPATRTVQVVAKHGDTKTTLLDSKYVRWAATDAIKAYGYLDSYVSTSTTISDGGATATFNFNLGEDEIVYMIYPAAAAGEMGSDDAIKVTIPTEQTAVANSFADGANVAIGAYDNGAAYFYSIGALVSFDIKNDNITSIKLECPGATLTGKGEAAIEEGDYIADGDAPAAEGTADYVLIKAAQGQTLTNGAKYFAVVYAGDYTGMKLTFTRNDGKTATYTNSAKLELELNSNYTIFNAQIPDSKWQGGAATVHDIFTSSDFPATSTTYANFTGVSKNVAVYAGNTNKTSDAGFSLRTNNSNSGIVTTTSGGNIKSVTVKWNSSCTTGRTLDVYGSNTAYTSVSELYNASTQGEKLGSIVMGSTTTKVEVSDDYAYVAVRSYSGALILDEIDFEWSSGSTPVTKYNVTCATVTGGTISADPTKAKEGDTVTLTASPLSGYEFESWNVTGATVADATSATTTFTMPAANVTVSATFKEITSIPNKTIAEFIAAEGGNCYLTGVVSNIINTTYGNFDLTDESGTIYIYGCLTPGGESRQFSTLGVEEGDEIKVLASEYEYYQSTTHEAKNVVFVEIVKKLPYLKATASKTTGIAAAGETVTVNVDTNIEGWTATSDNADFAISGKTATSFNVVVSANTTTSERSAKITVSATGAAPVEITLKQAVAGGSYESSGTLASWTFTSGTAGTNYPANKTNFASNGSSDLASGTFYLDGTGSTWNSSKGYAFTAVTSITITVKAAKDLKKGAKITFSMDTYYNKATNAPMTGFTLQAAEGSATASTTGLSVTSFSLSTSSANKSVDYTLQNDVAKDGTVKLVLTGTGKAGAGQGFMSNIKADYAAE